MMTPFHVNNVVKIVGFLTDLLGEPPLGLQTAVDEESRRFVWAACEHDEEGSIYMVLNDEAATVELDADDMPNTVVATITGFCAMNTILCVIEQGGERYLMGPWQNVKDIKSD